MTAETVIGILIPFPGTSLGAAMGTLSFTPDAVESRETAALFSCPEREGHLYSVSNAFLNVVLEDALNGLKEHAVIGARYSEATESMADRS